MDTAGRYLAEEWFFVGNVISLLRVPMTLTCFVRC